MISVIIRTAAQDALIGIDNKIMVMKGQKVTYGIGCIRREFRKGFAKPGKTALYTVLALGYTV
jgi:hypothetical protein